MRVKIRKSATKRSRITGYRARKKTHGGRAVIRRKRQRGKKGW